MPAIPMIAAVASAAVGVAGVVQQQRAVTQQKKAAKQQQAQFEQQETKAKEAAALEQSRDTGGAAVKLGAPATAPVLAPAKKRTGTARTGTVGNTLGGVQPAKRLGL